MHKAVGKKAGWRGGNPRGRGEREKQHEGLVSSLGLGEGWSAVRMSSGKTKGRPIQDGPLEIKSWRCSTFPRKSAQYHRRWRA